MSLTTITRLERGKALYPRTVEAAGVIFTNGDEPRVKLRKATA